jgi:transposase
MGKLSLYSQSIIVFISCYYHCIIVSLCSEKDTTRITKILAEEGINVSRTSVSKFLERYRKGGSLFDAPRSGRKSKLYQEHLTFIDERKKPTTKISDIPHDGQRVSSVTN